jgi:hypothetical protein
MIAPSPSKTVASPLFVIFLGLNLLLLLRDFFVLLLPLDQINQLVGNPQQMVPAGLIRTSLCYSKKTHDKSFQRFAIHGFCSRRYLRHHHLAISNQVNTKRN